LLSGLFTFGLGNHGLPGPSTEISTLCNKVENPGASYGCTTNYTASDETTWQYIGCHQVVQSTCFQSERYVLSWIFCDIKNSFTDFRNSDLERLSTMAFVPIAGEKDTDGGTVRWLPPTQCYLRGQTKESFHSKLFTFVDFGASGNAFLAACGTKNQPSVEEVAKILLDDPRHFYGLSGGPTK